MMKKFSFVKLKERLNKRSKNKCKQKEDKQIEDTKEEAEDGHQECDHLSEAECGQSRQIDINYDRLSTHSETNKTIDSNNSLETNKFIKFPTILLQSFRKKFRRSESKQKTNRISEMNAKKPEFGYHSKDSKTEFNGNQIDFNDSSDHRIESQEILVENQDVLQEEYSSDLPQTSNCDLNTDITKNKDHKKYSLVEEIERIVGNGWYWGPITRREAEDKLRDQMDGSFLVRDSSDDHYLFSLSFRSFGRTLHTRIEYTNGLFSFYSNGSTDGNSSLIDLIQHSMTNSEKGVFCYSRGRSPVSPSFPVRLTRPVSRFSEVRSLQYLCKFVIRQSTSFSQIQSLPLPKSIKGFIENTIY